MSKEVLFEKDMLYPTDNNLEPGCIHIQVLSPDNNAKIPVVIEDKSGHSPIKYIDSIARLMQTDIFDRILVDINKHVDIYIKSQQQDIQTGKNAYTRVCLADKTLSETVEF